MSRPRIWCRTASRSEQERPDASARAGDEDPHAQILGTIDLRSAPIRVAACLPAASTSSWLSGSPRHTGCGVGDQRDAEDLQPCLAGGDRLEGRGHADQVAADRADHADLGRGLVVRPGQLDVDALVEVRLDLAAERAQARGVEVGQVDEVRADDGRRGREVDVVLDQDRGAG